MSDQTIKLIAAGVLLLHGLGHGGALASPGLDPAPPWHEHGRLARGPLVARPVAAGRTRRRPSPARSGSCRWSGSSIAAMSFWGIVVPAGVWRPLAVAAALVSATGIVFFFGTWPTFNTLAALGVNVAVLVAVVVLRWPSEAMLGR